MASTLCQNNALVSWPQWAQSNLCQDPSSPAAESVPYATGPVAVPKWAHTALTTDGAQFDVGAALKRASCPVNICAAAAGERW